MVGKAANRPSEEPSERRVWGREHLGVERPELCEGRSGRRRRLRRRIPGKPNLTPDRERLSYFADRMRRGETGMSDTLFFAWFAFCVCWLAAGVAVSVLYRRRAGKPIRPSAPATAEFAERRCSGRSLKNVLTRLGGARNCLLVYISGGELVVTPTFPFTLMFLPEIYGMECRAAAPTITARIQEGLFGRTVRVSFGEGSGSPLELKLRHPEEFLRALNTPSRRSA